MNLMKELRRYWKKACTVIALGTVYCLWLWRDVAMEPVLFISNVLAVISLLFLLIALAGVMHNIHALSIFSYSMRYLSHLFRNLRNRDELTGEPMIGYSDYIQSYKKWNTVPVSFLLFFIFISLSLLVWFLF